MFIFFDGDLGILYANYYYGSAFVQETVGRFDFHGPAADVRVTDEGEPGNGHSFVSGAYGKLFRRGCRGIDTFVERIFLQCLGVHQPVAQQSAGYDGCCAGPQSGGQSKPTESYVVGTYEAASCRYARYADAREDEQLYGEQDGA